MTYLRKITPIITYIYIIKKTSKERECCEGFTFGYVTDKALHPPVFVVALALLLRIHLHSHIPTKAHLMKSFKHIATNSTKIIASTNRDWVVIHVPEQECQPPYGQKDIYEIYENIDQMKSNYAKFRVR